MGEIHMAVSTQEGMHSPVSFGSKNEISEYCERSIPERFEGIARRYPHRLAVKMGERALNYEELNRYANRIANAILDRRGGGSEPIAVLLEHEIDIVAAILAVLKAGKFYIAIDSSFPLGRMQHFLADSGAKCIVTDRANYGLAAQLEPIPPSLLMIDDVGDLYPGENIEIDIFPEDRSSIQYTSGSTGRPKGVTELHRNILHSFNVMSRELEMTINDRVALVHSLAFASGHTDLNVALLTGASLFPFNVKSEGVHGFAAWMQFEGITVCHLPPVLFRQLAPQIRNPEIVKRLRSIRLSGAPVFKSDFDLYKRHFHAETRLWVSMGTTETRGICSAVINRDFAFPQEGFPVGYAKPGMKIVIVDDEKNEVAPGEIGEIAVQSANLNLDYWEAQENGLHSAAHRDTSERLYFTGDLGRMLPDGLLIHFGRKDLIVKIRGYRVNMAEVENALLQHPDIQEAGIAAWDSQLGDRYLVGYVVPRHGSALDIADLNTFLRDTLPDHMIPSTFVPLEALPLTNGKLDRSALPKPQRQRPALGMTYLAPESEVEKKLAVIWAQALTVDRPGLDDNFFDLGGNSLAAASVVGQVKDVFGVTLFMKDLFKWPTMRALSREITRRDVARAALPREDNAVPSTQLCSKTGLEQSIPEGFEKIVKQVPGKVAIKDGSRHVTYAELNDMANRVAHSLRARETKEIEPVGIFIEKGVEQFAAMLGVMKSGKFFVLLDPAWPAARTIEILNDSGARLLLANNRHARKLGDASGRVAQVILMENIDPAVSPANLDRMIAPNRCACLTYTTGSTGKPKGVILSHRNVMHRIVLRTHKREVLAQDRVALLPSGTSNAISTAFHALLNGAALYPFDVKKEGVDRLATWLEQEKISVCFISSTLFRSLCQVLRGADNFPHLRFLRLRSETSNPGDVRLFRRRFSRRCVLVHSLSSSETGPLCEYLIDNQTNLQTDELPIGFVERDKEILLLDDKGNDVGCNRVGEIAVRSRFLSPGYWRQPELNKTKFRLDRSSRSRLYFTGDLALRLPDGCLIHKGRKDRRVKIRGYGVDLQEIEKVLRRHPAVEEAVVSITNDDLGEPCSVAYFRSYGEPPATTELRRFLSETIPDYMIPARFIRVQAWPLTPNGKVDRKALPVPDDQRPRLSRPYAPARNQIERMLVRTWEEVLGIKSVGINDDFFDLGGDSLKLARMLSQINEELRIDLSPGDFLTGAQIAALGRIIDEKARPAHEAGNEQDISRFVVNLRAGAGSKRIFCFPYRGGFHDEYFNFCRISRHFPSEFSFYGLRARGVHDGDRPRETIKQIAQDFIDAIRSVQPHGPYVFVGECGGGIPAFETARQLEALGEQVELLILLDTQAWSFGEYIGRRLKEPFTYRKRLGLLPPRLEYLDKRMQYHFDRMKQLRGAGRIHYLLTKCIHVPKLVAFHVGGGVIKNRLSPNTGSTASVPPISRSRISEKDYFVAAHRYRYRRYRGRIALLMNEEWYRRNVDLNWRPFAKGRFDVYPIPGDHDHCVPDNIPRVAEILKTCLGPNGLNEGAPASRTAREFG